MDKEQFVAIMPYICSDLVAFIVKKRGVSESEAMMKLYTSELYKILEYEETKLWQCSTEMLYSLLEQEEQTGEFVFPDV